MRLSFCQSSRDFWCKRCVFVLFFCANRPKVRYPSKLRVGGNHQNPPFFPRSSWTIRENPKEVKTKKKKDLISYESVSFIPFPSLHLHLHKKQKNKNKNKSPQIPNLLFITSNPQTSNLKTSNPQNLSSQDQCTVHNEKIPPSAPQKFRQTVSYPYPYSYIIFISNLFYLSI